MIYDVHCELGSVPTEMVLALFKWFVVPIPPESIRRDAAQKFTLGKSAPAVSGPEGNFFQLRPSEEIAGPSSAFFWGEMFCDDFHGNILQC